MTTYLIFNSEVEAQTANQLIFDTAIPLYKLQGYDSDVGGLIGKMDGVLNASGGRTSSWDIPRQRLDGKWAIIHPENHPAAQTILPDGSKALDILNSALGVVVKEVNPEDDTWFPLPEGP